MTIQIFLFCKMCQDIELIIDKKLMWHYLGAEGKHTKSQHEESTSLKAKASLQMFKYVPSLPHV